MGKLLDFEVTKDVAEKVYEASSCKGIRQHKKGHKRSDEAIERGIAKLVVVAEDVEPAEIVMHIR